MDTVPNAPNMPTMSTAQRRSRLVDRQLLGSAERSTRTIDGVAGQLGLLHSTDPSTTYLSIHARTDASIAEIDRALYDEPRRLLRHTAIRGTIFVMPADVVPLAHGACNPSLVDRLRRQLVAGLTHSPDVGGPADVFVEQTEAAVVEALTTVGPATGAQLATRVPALRATIDLAPGRSKPVRITSRVLEVLAAEGRIARGRPTGANFTSGSWTWAAAASWWPAGFGELDSAAALAGLLDRHLASFGPATVTDMAWWSGLTKGAVRTALAAIGAVEVALGSGETGWMRATDLDGAPSDRPATVVFLPGLDSTTMGWKQRSWFVDDSKETGLFDRNGNAGPTIWLGGRVIGAWTQRADGQVVTELFREVSSDVAAAVESEAARTSSWLGDVRVKWRFPTPITKRLAV